MLLYVYCYLLLCFVTLFILLKTVYDKSAQCHIWKCVGLLELC